MAIHFVGIDWGGSEHAVCVLDESGHRVWTRMVAHNGEAIEQLCDALFALGDIVKVSLEVRDGPLVEALLDRGLEVFTINPKQIDRFRDRYSPSGAKDDRRDALVLAQSLRTDESAYRQVKAPAGWVVKLRTYTRLREQLVRDRTRIERQLLQTLWRYYPQFLALVGHDGIASTWLCELWQMAQTPSAGTSLGKRRIETLLRRNRIRRITVDEVLEALSKTSLVVSAETVQVCVTTMRMGISRMQLCQIAELDEEIKAVTASVSDAATQRDIEVVKSMPGVGPHVLAMLLGEGEELLTRRDYRGMRMLAGLAPVTKQSGKSRMVVMRRACNKRLRNAAHYWALGAIAADPRWRQRFDELRARGLKYARALRTVADGLLRTLCAMLRDGTTYVRMRDQTHVVQLAIA